MLATEVLHLMFDAKEQLPLQNRKKFKYMYE